MRSESSFAFRVELADKLVSESECLDSLAEELQFDFVEYLVGFIAPVHLKLQNYY